MQSIKIDIVSDVNCPWCFLGEQRLKQAVATAGNGFEVSIRFKPFELNPQAPAEGEDKDVYFRRVYGPEALPRLQSSSEHLRELGRQEGIVFDFDKAKRVHNTFQAHRLIWLAEQFGVQEKVAHALFEANFTEGKNINDPAVLSEIGISQGIPAERLQNFFNSQEGVSEVRALEHWAQRSGISGVPAFIFNDKYLISGAQPTETFQQIFSKLEQEEIENSKGDTCSTEEGGEC
jgi:predicted DsbA family dithiol-disulfide isomerase